MLNRDDYVETLLFHNDDYRAKGLVGIRGVGKSVVFSQFIARLKERKWADDLHILYLNFEYAEFEKLRDIHALKAYITKKISDKNRYYVILDEIQHVDNFESLLRDIWFHHSNVSFYVGCSNSRFLPFDIQPFFQELHVVFYMTPLTYTETCHRLNLDLTNKTMLANYLTYGGLPGRFRYKKSSEVKDYLYSQLDSIYLKDIVMRMGIQDVDGLNAVFSEVMNWLGETFPYEEVEKTLQEKGIPREHFSMYLDCLHRSLLLEESASYNLRSNQEVYGVFRYYVGDFGFAWLRGFDFKNHMNAAMRNLVWLELKRKGYDLYTGVNGSNLIDIVAIHDTTYYYLQVVYSIEDGKQANQLFDTFEGFMPHGTRYLLSMDHTHYSRNGILHRHIFDFLSDPALTLEDDYGKNRIR